MSVPSLRDRRAAFIYLPLTTAIWGSLYVAARIALKTIPPITLVFARYCLSFPILFAAAKLSGKSIKVRREDRKYFFLVGIIGYFFSSGLQIVGTKFAGASTASLINSINPIFISFFAVILLKEKLAVRNIVAMIVALVGVYVVLGGVRQSGESWGIAFSLASVVLWGITSSYVRRLTSVYDPLVVTAYVIGTAALLALPAAAVELLVTPHGPMFSVVNATSVLYLAIVCTALAAFLWSKSLSLVEASVCSLFYPIQPLVSAVLGVLILGEKVGRSFALGAALIIGGIVFVVISDIRSRRLGPRKTGGSKT